MKIRSGFVSNSSSSSFIVISKNGDLTKDLLLYIFKIDKKSIFYPLAKQISEDIMYLSGEMTPEEYKSNYTYDSDDDSFKEDYPELYENYKKAKENNWKIYHGYADSVDNPILCDMEISYEDDLIIFEKYGGY
jgi:hypothetical protein